MASIDLYNQDISSFEMSQYLTQVKVLDNYLDRSESLSYAEIDFLKNNFKQLIGLVPMRVQNINSFSQPFERLVINQDVADDNKRLTNLSQLRYPPLSIADKIDYNRASLKGKCVMYAGSMGMLPTTIEVKPKRGQLITRSKWTFNGNRPLKMIVICMDIELAMSNPNELLDDFNEYNKCLQQMQPNCRKVVESVSEFMVKAFTRKVSPENRQGYIMSALISEFFYENPDEPVDAMYYPSVPNNGSAMNIAIKTEVVDELFVMTEASESVVSVDPSHNTGGWFSLGTASCNEFDGESLELVWKDSPHPPESELYTIVKDFNIKFKTMTSIQEEFQDLLASTREQLEFIENYYGSQVQYIKLQTAATHAPLSASIQEDKPVIKCNPDFTPLVDDITHEIWHLYLKAKLDIIGYQVSGNVETHLKELYGESYDEIIFALYSHVEHAFFFNKMIKDNLKPYDSQLAGLGSPASAESVRSSSRTQSDEITLETLFLMLAERDGYDLDPGFLRILNQNLPKECAKAKQILEVLNTYDQIESEPDIMARCLEILSEYDDKIEAIRKDKYYYLQ